MVLVHVTGHVKELYEGSLHEVGPGRRPAELLDRFFPGLVGCWSITVTAKPAAAGAEAEFPVTVTYCELAANRL